VIPNIEFRTNKWQLVLQGEDTKLRTELARLREQGEVTAMIKYGKIIK